jgi:hypothetical protein
MRRGLLICAIAIAALTTTACGGGNPADALQSVAGAATKTVGAQTAKFRLDIAETVGPVGPLHVTADGTSDAATKSVDMTMDLSGIAALTTQSGTVNPAQWKAHLILDGSGSSPVLYLQLPALDKSLDGKTWLEADLGALGQRFGVSVSQLLQLASSEDPTKALQMLQSIGSVSKTGAATIGGIQTTEYSGIIDVQKAAVALGPGASKLPAQSKITTVPVDVWIGSDGLVRQLHSTLSTSLHGMPSVTDITLDLSDFGTRATITPPPADQTLDIDQLKGIGA